MKNKKYFSDSRNTSSDVLYVYTTHLFLSQTPIL